MGDKDKFSGLFDELNSRVFGVADNAEAIEKKWQPETPYNKSEPNDVNDKLPKPLYFEKKPARRIFKHGMRKDELKKLVQVLPDEDTDIYLVSNGTGRAVDSKDIVQSFGFGSFLDFVIDEFGDGCDVQFSTWSMNKDHAWMLLEMLDNGKIANLKILLGAPFEARKSNVFWILKQGLARFEGSILKMFSNHSKIYCIANAEKTRFCTITGSANLSGNPRAENYVLSTSPDLYAYFKSHFFDVMFGEDDD